MKNNIKQITVRRANQEEKEVNRKKESEIMTFIYIKAYC